MLQDIFKDGKFTKNLCDRIQRKQAFFHTLIMLKILKNKRFLIETIVEALFLLASLIVYRGGLFLVD